MSTDDSTTKCNLQRFFCDYPNTTLSMPNCLFSLANMTFVYMFDVIKRNEILTSVMS